jgi:hypothetical protein
MIVNILEDLSATVALGAAFVAALSAVYARWQANAAKRANEIALHDRRLSVYNGLGRFRVQVTGHGPSLKEDEVWKFYEAVESSEFYFPSQVQPRLNHLFEEALKLLTLNDEWRHARDTEPARAPSLVKSRYDLVRELREECQRVTNELKPYLRVGDA